MRELGLFEGQALKAAVARKLLHYVGGYSFTGTDDELLGSKNPRALLAVSTAEGIIADVERAYFPRAAKTKGIGDHG